MYNCLFTASDCFKGLLDDVLPGLGQDLYGDVVGDQVLLDQGGEEVIFRLLSGGEAYLDFIKTDLA